MADAAPLSVRQATVRLRVASRVLPMRADDPCGDAAACIPLPSGPGEAAPQCLLAIVDGLGHGLDAAIAAQATVDLLTAHPALPLATHIEGLQSRLSSTRGVALGLVRIAGTQLQHVAIGNTRAVHLRGDTVTRLPSQNGIVGGGRLLKVTENRLQLTPGDWLLLFTDGIDERVHLPVRLPEWQRDPDLLCRHLIARWHAGNDDAGVLAVYADAAEGCA